ncbi:MAG: NADH-quinone oxidoreductase subunit K [Chlorobi bacterium]|nr:NADH-quinone oxidoreductase subunit K [Chlorobiota bacterium]
MIQAGINHFIFLSAALLALGIYTIIARKNIVRIIFGFALVFTASIINLAAFGDFRGFNPEGQINLYLTTAVCLLLLFAFIVLAYRYYKNHKTIELD